ncbi:MAG: tail fiber domain-containing protein [Flavobacteriales bacterium]|nr:tail fiber domain-containing protein [Flavobacteriales bacterium]
MKKLVFLSVLCLIVSFCIAQDGVGINTESPDASALLDVTSTNQGILVPRMTSAQRDLIPSAAQGLLIYSTSTNTFWFYNNTSWIEIVSSVSTDKIEDVDGDTRIEVEQTADDDLIRFTMRNKEYFQMEDGRINVLNTGNSVFMGNLAGRSDNGSNNKNVYFGNSAGQFSNTGENNVGIGYRALRANTSGSNNIGIGEDAFRRNKTGSFNLAIGSNAMDNAENLDSNMAIGFNALTNIVEGAGNIAIGQGALQDKTSGSYNVGVGVAVLENNLLGSRNTAVGRQAGYNSEGSGNVFLGYRAGFNEGGDDKLYIDNSSTTSPLIWGDFANDSLVINGDLAVTGNITYVGTITDVSDRRLKEDFDTLTKVMDLVNQLQAYSYRMKSNHSGEREFGLIAQEVKKVFPEMVKIIDQEKGYMGVNYLQLVAILIEGLKEQQSLIADFENRQDVSKQKLNELKAQVENIKSSLNVK